MELFAKCDPCTDHVGIDGGLICERGNEEETARSFPNQDVFLTFLASTLFYDSLQMYIKAFFPILRDNKVHSNVLTI